MLREDQVRMAHMLDAARSVARFIAGRQREDLRHRLLHAYFDANLDVLWKPATESVPAIKTQLEALSLGAE